MTLDEFFDGYEESRPLFDAVHRTVDTLGPAEVRVTKSQVAFRRKNTFAWTWIPEKHLHRRAAPLVLTLALLSRDASPRWKEIVEPAPGRFMHHLEVYAPSDIDDEVAGWLRSAWAEADH